MAGLEDVEKSLPARSTAWTRRSGTQSMLRVPLVASTGRPGYWLELPGRPGRRRRPTKARSELLGQDLDGGAGAAAAAHVWVR